MTPLLTAIGRALRDLTQPRVLAVLLLPMLGALILWTVLAIFFWDAWTDAFRSMIDATAFARWLTQKGATWLLESLSVVFVIAVLLPAIIITAVLITELIAMPVVVSVVGRRYRDLEKRSGGTFGGSMGNAMVAVSIFTILWVVTLPLWMTGIGAVVLPALNSAYLNQRLFRYDALAEHASRDEFLHIIASNKRRLYGLGLLLAPLYYVPLLNLAAPVVAGLAFTHFCLAELSRIRSGDVKN